VYAHPTYADAKRALDRLHRALRLVNESAAASIAEGLDVDLSDFTESSFRDHPELIG
jgi:mevalonate pyrophosphate decarboxylase